MEQFKLEKLKVTSYIWYIYYAIYILLLETDTLRLNQSLGCSMNLVAHREFGRWSLTNLALWISLALWIQPL